MFYLNLLFCTDTHNRIYSVRNAVEGNDASAEFTRQLKANEDQAVDTPELRNLGIKVDLDPNGNVKVSRRNE